VVFKKIKSANENPEYTYHFSNTVYKVVSKKECNTNPKYTYHFLSTSQKVVSEKECKR